MSLARITLAVAGMVLAAMVGTVWAQDYDQPQKYSLTGNVIFGYAGYSGPNQNEGGPALSVSANMAGYWRDPRILQYEVEPIWNIGAYAPETGINGPMKGISASAVFLKGSPFPLSISYTRDTSTLSQSSGLATDVLRGAENNTTSEVFNVIWELRFKHFPVVNINYRDTDYSAGLPTASGGSKENNDVRDLIGQADYTYRGWRILGLYQHITTNISFPDMVSGSPQSESDTSNTEGVTVSTALPLNSSLGASASHSTSDYNVSGIETDTKVTMANASFASQPVSNFNTLLTAQYTSNVQAFELQQALSGAGVTGGTSSAPVSSTTTSTLPLNALAAPLELLTITASAAYRLGHGFSLNGSAEDSHESISGSTTSTLWSLGPAYQRNWHSGWLVASFSHSSQVSNVVNESSTTGVTSTTENTASTILTSLDSSTNTGAVNLVQTLRGQFKLSTTAHATFGTNTSDGVAYPNHDYGGIATLARPVGAWTLTGSLTMDKNANDFEAIYNATSSEAVSFTAAYHHLNVSVGQQFGSGLALQSGTSVIFVSSPALVGPLLGPSLMSSTNGTNVQGSYSSQKGRLHVLANWSRFTYTSNLSKTPTTEYNIVNLFASYRLRLLRVLGGYDSQSQSFGNSSGDSEVRVIYFGIERDFRIF
jgi:hypothetical protein